MGGTAPRQRFGLYGVVTDQLRSKETVDMPWWDGKERVREYLRGVNERENVSSLPRNPKFLLYSKADTISHSGA